MQAKILTNNTCSLIYKFKHQIQLNMEFVTMYINDVNRKSNQT